MQKLFIGVDGGGTKTKVLIEDESGNILATAKSGPANIKTSVQKAWQSIRQGIQDAALAANLNLSQYELHVGLGLAGVEVPSAKSLFLSVPHEFNTLMLESDAYVACLGVHGGHDGAIIIIGTGVNGYMVEAKKRTQVSGWGFPHDDKGGGAWLGLLAVGETFKYIDGRLPASPLLEAIFKRFKQDLPRFVTWANQAAPSDFGQIAPVILEYVGKDALADALVNQAASEIDSVIEVLRKKTHLPQLKIALLGGIAPFIEPRLKEENRALIVPRKHDATKGAILMLRQTIQ